MLTPNEQSVVDFFNSIKIAQRKYRNNGGVILYEGPSRIDGKPIVMIATGLNRSSANSKTGDMIQTWIMRSDIPPHHATNLGEDESICGDCPHRPASSKNPYGQGTCYVKVFQAPLNIWRKYKRGGYSNLTNLHYRLFKNRHIRLGSYGDPSAIPYELLESLVKVSKNHTAYTHSWRLKKNQIYKNICMASVDSPEQAELAIKMGWRYFHVAPNINVLDKKRYEFICPASNEAGKRLTCEQCSACHGGNSKANVFIVAHGMDWKVDKVKQIAKLKNQKKSFRHLVNLTVNRQKVENELKEKYKEILTG